MFENKSLWTCDGKLVADVSIPKFNPPAEVLTWGSRTFIRNAAGEYREGMNFFVPLELSSVPFSQKYCSQPDGRAEAPAIAQNASETMRVDADHAQTCQHGDNPSECVSCSMLASRPSKSRPERVTLSGRAPELPEDSPAPAPIDPVSGQHRDYWVLSAAERAQGFVRPVRTSYRHLKCGAVTSMGLILAETYARDPKFYGATMCATCRSHFPLIETDASKAAFEAKDGFRRAFIWIESDGTEKEGVGEGVGE